MNWDQVEGKWKQFAGNARSKWGKLPTAIGIMSRARRTTSWGAFRSGTAIPRKKLIRTQMLGHKP